MKLQIIDGKKLARDLFVKVNFVSLSIQITQQK